MIASGYSSFPLYATILAFVPRQETRTSRVSSFDLIKKFKKLKKLLCMKNVMYEERILYENAHSYITKTTSYYNEQYIRDSQYSRWGSGIRPFWERKHNYPCRRTPAVHSWWNLGIAP